VFEFGVAGGAFDLVTTGKAGESDLEAFGVAPFFGGHAETVLEMAAQSALGNGDCFGHPAYAEFAFHGEGGPIVDTIQPIVHNGERRYALNQPRILTGYTVDQSIT
jgi:hypothetical protein